MLCAGVERASAAIAAAGGPGDAPRIEGPQGKYAVHVYGANLRLRGVAVAASGSYSYAVYCTSKGRAELAGCTLSSPGTGLYVRGGATAEVQGGSIADCSTGVDCLSSGSKATVRTARPRTAEGPRATCLARWRLFSPACRSFFRPFFASPEPPRREG